MIRITKLTDYALILLNELDSEKTISAKQLSEITHIPLATTTKILKILTPAICLSKGGKRGGYYLSASPNKITLLNIINVMEGNTFSLTECSNGSTTNCSLQSFCKTKNKLNLINKEITDILSAKTLADLK